jgi:hypothetical protein
MKLGDICIWKTQESMEFIFVSRVLLITCEYQLNRIANFNTMNIPGSGYL